MALDPRILLQQTTPDVMTALQRGIAAGQAIKQAPLLEAMQKQRLAQAKAQEQRAADLHPLQMQQLEAQMAGTGTKVGARKIFADGTILQSTPVGPRVFSPSGEQLSGDAAETQLKAAFESEVTLAGSKARAGAEARSEVELGKQEKLTDILTKRKVSTELATDEAALLSETVERGLDAVEQLPNIKRGLELLDKVGTGGVTARSKVITDFFGSTSGDVSELNNILAENVLAGLANFKGALSDSERLFVERMQTGLSQGTEFNIRQLKRMENLLNKKVSQAKRAANLTGNTFALELLNEDVQASGFGAPVAQQPAQAFEGFEIINIRPE